MRQGTEMFFHLSIFKNNTPEQFISFPAAFMKVLLINPVYPERPRAIFPLGLAYVATSLLANGHDVEVLDTDALYLKEADIRKRIQKGGFDIVGTGGLITAYNHIKWLISIVKEIKPDIPVMVGGGGASSVPKLMLKKTQADIVVMGEGENTVIEILNALNRGDGLSGVKGIFFKKNGSILQNPPAPPIEKIDSIPFPKWDLFCIEKYMQANMEQSGIRFIPVFASRSCPYSCTFCFHPIGKIYRSRSSKNIIDEIKYLITRYDVKYVQFIDELFIFKKKQLIEFCNLLIKENINVKWGCASRTNIADVEIYRLMKKAGCTNFQYGIESGSDEMLKKMKKNDTVEGTKKALKIARDAGFEPRTTFMIGTIGENEKTIKETTDFIKEMNIRINAFFFTTPYPGTSIYEWALKNKRIKDEEKFIKTLGNAVKFTINLTNLSDWKLIKLKCKAEKEVKSYYDKNNIPEVISTLIDKDKIELEIKCLLHQCKKVFKVTAKGNKLIQCPNCGKKHFISKTLLIKNIGINRYLGLIIINFVDIKSMSFIKLSARLYTGILAKFSDKAVIVYLSTHPIIKQLVSFFRNKNYWE